MEARPSVPTNLVWWPPVRAAHTSGRLIEQAGGMAFSGDVRTLEIQPTELHQRVPVLLGSPDEVQSVQRLIPAQ